MIHKYLLKTFYRWTNKEEYESKILQYNIHHTNIFSIYNAIIIINGGQKKQK